MQCFLRRPPTFSQDQPKGVLWRTCPMKYGRIACGPKRGPTVNCTWITRYRPSALSQIERRATGVYSFFGQVVNFMGDHPTRRRHFRFRKCAGRPRMVRPPGEICIRSVSIGRLAAQRVDDCFFRLVCAGPALSRGTADALAYCRVSRHPQTGFSGVL